MGIDDHMIVAVCDDCAQEGESGVLHTLPDGDRVALAAAVSVLNGHEQFLGHHITYFSTGPAGAPTREIAHPGRRKPLV